MDNLAPDTGKGSVLIVNDMPHFAPYLQFITNIIQIHFEHVKLGRPDYYISDTMDRADFDEFYNYLYELPAGAPVEINERYGRVLYASLVVVSRLLICEYGEEVCGRLIRNLPAQHRWSKFEHFRNDLLRHNSQLLLDLDGKVASEIAGLEQVKKKLEQVTV